MPATSRNFRLLDLLFFVTICCLCSAWYADRKRIESKCNKQVITLSGKIEDLELAVVRESKLRKMLDRFHTPTLIAALESQIDVATLASGVVAIQAAGGDFDGAVYVTFKNGNRFLRTATLEEYDASRKLIKAVSSPAN